LIVADMESYTELSPSGTGLRIVARGRKPDRRRSKKGPVEIYDGLTAKGEPGGRYLTFTGNRIDGAPADVQPRQEQLATVYYREIAGGPEASDKEKAPPCQGPQAASSYSDSEVIAKASKAKNGAKFTRLWSGDISGYPSHSEADLGLCRLLAFWCELNPERIGDVFAQSGLFRSKWNREDYRQRTTKKAIEGKTDYYRGTATISATAGPGTTRRRLPRRRPTTPNRT
jgi:primase-polymerase (primpol)-like protein